ncbi:CAPN9 [Branchiostoma lanceolatum]|uniref:CAPN9 protein n=1 Tax=Branchiostoma lanceolatum TaxID=7740 RepID=A0A8K0EJF6_BRALA|nr:CAPN9 [Branchiostoma lanceolatum]
MATPDMAVPFKRQVYAEIKRKAKKQGTLWEDPEFPAEDKSIYDNAATYKDYKFTWMRPGDIVATGMPEFASSHGASRFDVCQLIVGDCWLLAAMADLVQKPKLFKRVCCEDNSYGDDYCGVFHFRFWQYGKWVDVVIDDLIPMVVSYQGESQSPEYFSVHSSNGKEFWSALLEKAYAKLHGSYESLNLGFTSDALVDFTGGITERYDTQDELPDDLYKMLQKAFKMGSTMGCSGIKNKDDLDITKDGLVKRHMYSITGFAVVKETQLIRIRNPWGEKTEWNGPWGDGSEEWNSVDETTKTKLGVVNREDGEFWMSFEDFPTHWKNIGICNLTPDAMEEGHDPKLTWNVNSFNGQWIKNMSAGGCLTWNKETSFATNPQFKVNLTHGDDGDKNKTSCLVSLLQKYRRRHGKENLFLGFEMDLAKGRNRLKTNDVKTEDPVGGTDTYTDYRECSKHFKLTPGEYIVIPTTYGHDKEGEFVLRVFTEKKATVQATNEGKAIIKQQSKPKQPIEGLSDEKKEKFRPLFETVAGLSSDDEEAPAIDPFELKTIFDRIFKENNVRMAPSGGAASRPLRKQQENVLSTKYQVIAAFAPTPDGLGGTGRRPMLSGRPSDRRRRQFVDGLNCVGTGGTAFSISDELGTGGDVQGRAS